jgi:hypothetical protein
MEKAQDQIVSEVQEYYGKTLATNADLKTNACCIGGDPGYTK